MNHDHTTIALLTLAVVYLCLAIIFGGCNKAHAEDCYPSLHSARQAHPRGHIGWSGGCFYPGYHHHYERERGDPASRRYGKAQTTAHAATAAPERHPQAPPPVDLPTRSDPPAAVSDPVEPRHVQTYRVVHVPEFDTSNDDGGDASFDERFGRAYAMVARPDIASALLRKLSLERLTAIIEEQRHAIAELREALEQAVGK